MEKGQQRRTREAEVAEAPSALTPDIAALKMKLATV